MKILIFDDKHCVVETIVDYLELMDMTIDCVYHGEAALHLVHDNHYDVIVMDVTMPKLDGISVVKKLREELSCNIPILFLTARDSLEDKVSAFNAGGNDYLLKPFALEELVLRLKVCPRLDAGKLTFADVIYDTQTEDVTRAGSTQ